MVRRSQSRGFTLLEVLVASALSGIAIAAAFTFATFQVKGFSQAQDVQQIASSSRTFEDTIGSDIRSAGYGTTFWAGTGHPGSFGGRAVVLDGGGQPLGVPAVRMIDNANGPVSAVPGQGVLVGSDALTILRVESISTNLPSTGAGQTGLADAPYATGPFQVPVADINMLRACGTPPNGSNLVLISDMVRSGEPASMLQQIANIPAGPGGINFVNGTYLLNPATISAPNGAMPAPRLFGPGSLVTCVRLVTYWVDNIGRLRLFQGGPANANTAGGVAPGLTGAWPGGAALPINPNTDAVIADGVGDLQIALFMSNMSPVSPGTWAFGDPAFGSAPLVNQQHIVETRAVRVSALLMTPRANENVGVAPPLQLENHPLVGGAALNRNFVYRQISTVAELRNLRLYDLMSSNARTWSDVRSYPP